MKGGVAHHEEAGSYRNMKEGMLCLAIVQALIVAAGVCGDVLRYTESGLLGSPVWQEGSARLVLLTADGECSQPCRAPV